MTLAGAGLCRGAGGTLPEALALVQVKLILALHAEVSAEAALAAGRPTLCREGRPVNGTAGAPPAPTGDPKPAGSRLRLWARQKGTNPPNPAPLDPMSSGMPWEMKPSPFPRHWDPQGVEGSKGH